MKSICLYFQVHQPFRLRNYKFFDIGNESHYFDERNNRKILNKVAQKCYIPTNKLLLDLIYKHKGKFKISFSISGTAIDQFERYSPRVLQSFKDLADTDCVEFLCETYSHSLSALMSRAEFEKQVDEHKRKIRSLFGKTPKVFRNTELIYSDEIGSYVHEMGFKGMLTEGADHILEWKSPNHIYYNPIHPEMKLLLKNFRLSDDIAFRFSQQSWNEWPLTVDKYIDWLKAASFNSEIINLFMDYETFGEHQWKETGIFQFLARLPQDIINQEEFEFVTPSEALKKHQPVGPINVIHPISWADEERDLTAWLGNDLQEDAFNALYKLEPLISVCKDKKLLQDWKYLQTSDHFYYMCTKYFADGDVHMYFNHYSSPYEAYINFMNVLSDYEKRLRMHLTSLTPEMKSKIRGKVA